MTLSLLITAYIVIIVHAAIVFVFGAEGIE